MLMLSQGITYKGKRYIENYIEGNVSYDQPTYRFIGQDGGTN